MRVYKRFLDITLLVSYGLMLLLVAVLIFGILVQAYDFADSATSFIKPGFGYLRNILIFLVAAIIIFVVAARVLLSFIEGTEKLESAADYRKKMEKTARKKTERVAFSQTDTYKRLLEKQEKQKANLDSENDEETIEVVKEEQSKSKVKVIEILPEEIQEDEVIEDEVIEDEVIEDEVIEDEVIEDEEVEDQIVEDEVKNEILVASTLPTKSKEKQYYTRLTKSEIGKIVSQVTGLNGAASKRFVNHLLDVITEELVNGNVVKIEEFGKFEKRVVKAKQSVNPQTQEKIEIEAHHAVKFTADKIFKDHITNDVTDTSARYLLTKTASDYLSEEEVRTELLKEEVIKEHIDIRVVEEIIEEVAEMEEKVVEVKQPKKAEVVKPKAKKVLPTKKTKADIIEIVSMTTDLSKNKADKFLKHFGEVIAEELAKKQDVKIDNLGIFTTIEIPTKEAVNPSTGEKITVDGHTQVRLRFDKSYKDIFN